jgi:hypothetical protein
MQKLSIGMPTIHHCLTMICATAHIGSSLQKRWAQGLCCRRNTWRSGDGVTGIRICGTNK